jgi:hypothetical protein
MMKPDHDPLSEDEIAMMVALHHGNEPSPDDPLCNALEARGLARRSAESAWELTPAGVDYVAHLG